MKNVLFILDILFAVTMVTCLPQLYFVILLKNVLVKISYEALLMNNFFIFINIIISIKFHESQNFPQNNINLVFVHIFLD